MKGIESLQDKASEIKKNIEEGKVGIDSLRVFFADIDDKCRYLQSELNRVHEEQRNVENIIDDVANDPDCNKRIPVGLVDELAQRETNLEKEISKFSSIKEEIHKYLDEFKVFEKNNCLNNIRYLLQNSDVKIGQIEKKAGVRPGYMSRLEKPDNTSEPSIQFVATAAKMLDVTIDELIYDKMGELSKDEKYIRDFIKDIIEDTKIHEIHWHNDRYDILYQSYHVYGDKSKINPLLLYDEYNLDENGLPMKIMVDSQFYKESNVYTKDGGYYAKLPFSSSIIYILGCYTNKNEKIIPNKEFVEIYIVDQMDKVNPVCNTIQACSEISAAVNTLFKLVMSDSVNVYMDDDTRSIIDIYRERRKERNKI